MIFKAIGDWLIARSLKTPFVHLPGYMNRYWLLPYGWLFKGKSMLDWAVRVHEILRSDEDTYHDHPWPYISVILRGGYFEVVPVFDKSGLYVGSKCKWYGPGSVLFRKAKSWHWLQVPGGETVWTLFITFNWQQKWGFMVQPSYKVRHENYTRRGVDAGVGAIAGED